jgi:hypothetical protein
LAYPLSLHRFLIAAMARERPGRSKFAKLMSNHVFRHVDGNVLVTVVNTKRKPNELGQDRRATAPDLDNFVAPRSTDFFRLLQDVSVDKRTFPN